MNHVELRMPAFRAFQAGRPFYTTMCPIEVLLKLVSANLDNSSVAGRASLRRVSRSRVRTITKHIIDRSGAVYLAPITVSIEDKVRFIAPKSEARKQPVLGELVVSPDAKLTIIDGLHRTCALRRAVAECPRLLSDAVAMVIHVDADGSRRDTIISDVKRFQYATAPSLRIGHDDHDELARLTRQVIASVPTFKNAIELEKTSISNRSRKLFTLSAIYHANKLLLADRKVDSYSARLTLATDFWLEVARQIPLWEELTTSKTSAAEIRATYVHCHAVGIAAIARAGNALLNQSPKGWRKQLARLSSLDWSRQNTACWEGRAMIGGRLSKSTTAVIRTGNVVKRHLGVKLSADDEAMEKAPAFGGIKSSL